MGERLEIKARRVRRSSAALLAVTLLAAPARAEEVSSLMPGQRVRVAAAAPGFNGQMVGNVVKVGQDTLTLVDPRAVRWRSYRSTPSRV
jgi:hypothetical protein